MHLLNAERLDHVADFDIVIAGHPQAAFESLANLAYVFLKALEQGLVEERLLKVEAALGLSENEQGKNGDNIR